MSYSGVRRVENPEGSSQPVIFGGYELAATESEQSGGQDAPTSPIESGAEITQRNVLEPESGTVTGWTDTQGLSGLQQLYRIREPITITTPEATIPLCVIEEITRTREGQYVDAFRVTVEWRQIFLAELGTSTITAVTIDGPKGPVAGEGPITAQPSLVGGDIQTTSNGPDAGAPGSEEGDTASPTSTSSTLGEIGGAIGDFL